MPSKLYSLNIKLIEKFRRYVKIMSNLIANIKYIKEDETE